jgi:hypothetical protein
MELLGGNGKHRMRTNLPSPVFTSALLVGGSAGASQVFTNLAGSFPEFPVFAVLTMQLLPGPGTVLLLGSGIAGLALLGRKRSPKQRARSSTPRGSHPQGWPPSSSPGARTD